MAEYKLDMSKKIQEVYAKIATWHNGDKELANKTNLIVLSQELVEDIISFTIKELDVKTKIGVELDNDAAKKEFLEKIMKDSDKSEKKDKKGGFFGMFK